VSRKRTPWSSRKSVTLLEAFITVIYEEKYNDRHKEIVDSNESSFLNDLSPLQCPYCRCEDFIKNGKYKTGVQRYRCTKCHKSFNVLTHTIFDNHKISISEWIEFLLYLFNYESIQQISKSNKNSPTTTKYWLKKVFLVLEHYQDHIQLSGNVYIDETYYKVVQSKLKKKTNGKEYAGLSINQICIGVAYDGFRVYLAVEGYGKTNETKTIQTFSDHIQPKSHLIHDKEKSHNALIRELSLTHTSYDGNELKKLEDKDNPLEPINRVVCLLQTFLKSHPGFNRDELQSYLDLFAFMVNEKGEPLEKVKRMVYLSLITPISLKYRDYYGKKPKIK